MFTQPYFPDKRIDNIDIDYHYCNNTGDFPMEVFVHHIYEYRKGLRSLILHTMHGRHHNEAVSRLIRLGIAYHVTRTPGNSINLFFGAEECVAVVKSFGEKQLNELTPEQDFILGTMLGYGLTAQCARYSRFKTKELFAKNDQSLIA